MTLVKGAKKNSNKGFAKNVKGSSDDKQKAAIAIAVKGEGKGKRKRKGK
jgi:hypothetical protein